MTDFLKKNNDILGLEHNKKGRTLVWHDEFAEGKINFDKWKFYATMGANDHLYDNSERHARVENGQMHLQVHKNESKEKPWSLSNGFTTYDTMLFKYGYLEMRAKIPFRHGAWPSFWMLSKTPFRTVDWFSEIDIFEVFSSEEKLVCNLHKWCDGKHSSLDSVLDAKIRSYYFRNLKTLNDEYHVYGFEWDKDYMRFYVDGEMFCEFAIGEDTCQVPNDLISGVQGYHDFHFVTINNEVFTPNGGWVIPDFSLTDDDPLPIDYYIDWIRLYQKDGEEILLKDDIAERYEAI